MEEQFYIIWPILLLLALLIRHPPVADPPGPGHRPRLIVIPTLAWSIHLTATDPARAYFVTTTTRLWELGVGALVAVGTTVSGAPAPRLQPPSRGRPS